MTQDRSQERIAEERVRLAVEACPDGMVMTDGAGAIVLVNAEAERLFGYRRDELIGRPIDLLVPLRLRGENFGQDAAFASRPRARQAQTRRELFGLRRNGTEFPIEIRVNPIRSGDGLFVLNVIVDLSDRRRMDRRKDEFVSTVSHELRTPLTSIAGSLGLLIGGSAGRLPEAALRLLTIAQTNSQRLVRLINDILDIEKIESGEVAFRFRRIDVRALIEEVIEANRAYAESFAVRVRFDTEPNACEVHADQDRLAQVVTNLLANAIKFSPRGGEVAVAVTQDAGLIRISVRDHGGGIPEKFKPRVFEKFAQADLADARQKGSTGLGLSIVKQIVTRLGGTVGFADAAGGGTVFHVELPSWTRIAARQTDTGRPADAVRILLCDDDSAAALALRKALRTVGYSTDFAYDPADALARSRTGPYAAIVIGCGLSDAGGIGLVQQLRERPESYRTPIVLTGGSRAEQEEAGKLDGVKWIAAPRDIYQLAHALGSLIARGAHGLPRILHVDDDHDVLELVAHTLERTARVVSADSIAQARQALMTGDFDLVVLDITLGPVCALDLLPELRSRSGAAIPVIIFSAHVAELKTDTKVEAELNKFDASLDDLVTAVHDRLMLKSAQSRQEVA